jgi:hypothetical protein
MTLLMIATLIGVPMAGVAVLAFALDAALAADARRRASQESA